VQSSKSEVVDEAASVKVVIRQTPPARGFLQRGFLNSSLAEQVLPKLSVASLSTLVVKEYEGGRGSLSFGLLRLSNS
jgi:hypothetical protein